MYPIYLYILLLIHKTIFMYVCELLLKSRIFNVIRIDTIDHKKRNVFVLKSAY